MNIVDEIKNGRKDLSCADLSDTDLHNVDLSDVDLSDADFSNADLRDADLRYADFSNADFSNADLSGADLSGADLLVFQAKLWTAYIQKDVITIGCQRHMAKKWKKFTNKKINKMHPDALNYWKKYKDIIFSIHANLEN